MPDFYEFFAGGGMARAGLGQRWRCLFANDIDEKKSATYRLNWGPGELKTASVETVKTSDLPGVANLIWASFPCQDLSLAGAGAGLRGTRSGTFWPFWQLAEELVAEGRAPEMIVLENVCGTLTSHEGQDFKAICNAVSERGYRMGGLVLDAALFVPHSRPRLFIVCLRADLTVPEHCWSPGPVEPWHTQALRTAHQRLSDSARHAWIWWNPPIPSPRRTRFADLIEEEPSDVAWFTRTRVQHLIAQMSDVNQAKLKAAQARRRRVVGGVYRRTRPDESGKKIQRAEIRFDDVSGCLRTPAGGSSRQIVVVVEGDSVRARLISTRETARLMGLPETYALPENYNEGYRLTGDGVVVPVVRHLAEYIIEPTINHNKPECRAAA